MPDLSSMFSGQMGSTMFMILIIVAMFAIMIIPQRKKEKKYKEMISALKSGDCVKTIGGLYGTISSIKDDHVTIVCGPDKVKLVFNKSAIHSIDTSDAQSTETLPTE